MISAFMVFHFSIYSHANCCGYFVLPSQSLFITCITHLITVGVIYTWLISVSLSFGTNYLIATSCYTSLENYFFFVQIHWPIAVVLQSNDQSLFLFLRLTDEFLRNFHLLSNRHSMYWLVSAVFLSRSIVLTLSLSCCGFSPSS